jgi:hypothetical protein
MALAKWQSTIVDNAGNVLPGAQITVRREALGGPLAVLFQDGAGTVPLGNPFSADSTGFAAFFTAGGPLRIDLVAGGFSRTLRDVLAQPADIAALTPTALHRIVGDGSKWTSSGKLQYVNAQGVGGSDLNVLLTPGLYDGSSLANSPDGSANWFYVLVQQHSNSPDYVSQTAWNLTTTNDGGIWRRIRHGAVWQPWRRLLADNELASVADVRSAAAATATDAQLLTAPLIASASDLVTIADAATITPNWTTFINGLVTIAGNRTLALPTNIQPGTWRTLHLFGNDATARTLTFGAGYLSTNTAPVTGITNNTNRAMIPLFGLNTSIVLVGAPLRY